MRLAACALVVVSLGIGSLARAQGSEPDPTTRSTGKPLFTPLDLVALGSFAVMTVAITPADVTRVAHTYLDPARLTTLIVGDHQAIGTSLDELGLGDAAILPAEG